MLNPPSLIMAPLISWFSGPSASRLYVDLIMKAADKWANWDPPKTIEVGDFGLINKNTGQFEKAGNIYTHPDTAELVKGFPAETKVADEKHILISRGKRINGAQVGGANPGSPAEISLQVKFSKRRGAVLVMYKPVMKVIPNEFFTIPEHIKNPFFKGKQIVSEVHACAGYALILSDKDERTVNLSLNMAQAGNASATWSLDTIAGTFRQGYADEPTYYPLYNVKEVRTPAPRRQPNAPRGDRWTEVDMPWRELDSDGEEVVDETDSEMSD